MKFSTTDGKEYYSIDMCVCCQMTTGGEHENNCPNNHDPRFVFTDPNQVWYWTKEWQKMEKEADEDMKLGNYEEFSSMDCFLLSLESLRKEWDNHDNDIWDLQ